MVQVYVAELPAWANGNGAKEQSKWAHVLLQKALRIQYPAICEPVLLGREPKGKPFLLEYPWLHINLSHSKGYVACAIGEKPVGVDIECWRSRKRPELVVKKFHPKERDAYGAIDEEQKERLFHELWVLKESFMKAEGSGLLIPLDSFYMEDIQKETGKVIQNQNSRVYYYRLYQMENKRFSLAACSEEADFCEEPVWIPF